MTGESRMVQNAVTNREVDILKVGRILLSRWYILAGTTLLMLLAAYIYLWYTPKTYATTGSLKFEEQKSALSELTSTLTDNASTLNIQSERFTIQSRHLLQQAIRKLNYPVSFYRNKSILQTDLYPLKPLKIDILSIDTTGSEPGLITFNAIDQATFQLSWSEHQKQQQKTFSFNSRVKTGNTSFMIRSVAGNNNYSSCTFQFNTTQNLLVRVKNGLRISEPAKGSNIITLQQTDVNPQFATDILKAILEAYLEHSQMQKRQSATQVIGFINDQLKLLSPEVKGAEQSLESYKRNNRIMDVGSSAEIALTKISDLESQLSLQKMQLIATEQLKKDINSEQKTTLLNLNLEGNIDPLLGSLVQNINALINERNDLLKVYEYNAAAVRNINSQIQEIKTAAMENIQSSQARIRKNMAYLSGVISQTDLQVSNLPTAEKNLLGLRRNFEINDKIYSYLSEKSLEAQVNRSAITSGASIIESPQLESIPVSPNSTAIYRSAIMLGLLCGVVIIIMTRLTTPNIYSKTYITEVTKTPVIGSIRKSPVLKNEKNNPSLLLLNQSRSAFAESVRNVRTNISFLATGKNSKVICVTSESSGEGKSFIALNLASTMTLIDKKVILIDADLRRPKLHRRFTETKPLGLSNYLVGQCALNDIIQPIEDHHFDFISCGQVPPNPAELLHSELIPEMMASLRTQYDIIIIDTAPIGIVTDSTPLIRSADINLFVIRYGVSSKLAATLPERISAQYSLNNFFLVLNAFEQNTLYSSIYKKAMDDTDPGDYRKRNSGYYTDEITQRRWWNVGHWFER